MREHQAVNRVDTQKLDLCFNPFVSSFVSFSINGLKENTEIEITTQFWEGK